MTEGLDKNRLAITSGFDKMDEVKKWDLQQLPDYEAIEEEKEEEDEEEEDILEKINELKNLVIKKNDIMEKLVAESDAKFKSRNIKDAIELKKKAINQSESIKNLRRKIERLQQTLKEEFEEETVEKPKITTVTYEKDDMDKYLNNKESIDLLNFYGLKLSSKYKDKNLEEFQKAYDKGMFETANLKESIKNVAKYKKDTLTGQLKEIKQKINLKNLSDNIISCKFLSIIWGNSKIIK